PYPGKNDGARERLVYVIHGTDIEALLLVDRVDLGGKKDDGNVARPRVVLELAADLIAVPARPHHVEQDQVWLLGAGRDGQRLLSVSRHLGPERVLQHARNDGNVGRCIIDNEYKPFIGDAHRIRSNGVLFKLSFTRHGGLDRLDVDGDGAGDLKS